LLFKLKKIRKQIQNDKICFRKEKTRQKIRLRFLKGRKRTHKRGMGKPSKGLCKRTKKKHEMIETFI